MIIPLRSSCDLQVSKNISAGTSCGQWCHTLQGDQIRNVPSMILWATRRWKRRLPTSFHSNLNVHSSPQRSQFSVKRSGRSLRRQRKAGKAHSYYRWDPRFSKSQQDALLAQLKKVLSLSSVLLQRILLSRWFSLLSVANLYLKSLEEEHLLKLMDLGRERLEKI